jgi:hypothetical protein
VIHLVVTADHAYTVREFLRAWAPDLRPRTRIVRWEQAGFVRGAPPGAWVLADLDRLTEGERARARALGARLRAAGPSVRVLGDADRTLGRLDLLRALHAAGVNSFRAFPLAEAEGAVRWPAFLRGAATHDGALSGLLRGPEDLRRAAADLLARRRDLRAEDLLLVEWIDARGPHGLVEKRAAMRVGTALLPRHLLRGRDWVLKEPEVVDDAALAAEAAFLRDFPERDEVARALDLAGAEYGRIDYAVVDGRVQVFEVNSNPILVPAPWRLHPARREGQARSAAALHDAFLALDAGLPDPGPRPLLERAASRVHRSAWKLLRRRPRR